MEKTTKNIRALLANHLGIETDDIKEDDFLDEDLHMNPGDISEFLEKLAAEGIDVTKINLEDLQTVEDLIDMLDLHQDIN